MTTPPSTGHHEIDSQHTELDRLIAKVLVFCSETSPSTANCTICPSDRLASCRREVMALIRELLKFMVGHFRYEDQLMRRLPDNDVCREHVRRHQRAHGDISARLSVLTATLATSDPYVVAAELQRILADWTGTHAVGLDSHMVQLHQQPGLNELDEDAELARLLVETGKLKPHKINAGLFGDKEVT